MKFQETGHDAWVATLTARGITDLTPVQLAVWEPFSKGRDLVVQSATGTGKTLAYLAPLFQRLDTSGKNLQALILVPTQELAVQIHREMVGLSPGTGVRSLLLMGGVNVSRQVEMLKEKPHVAVGTPGRVLELLEKKKITGHYLITVVLDEADRLFDPAILPTLRSILKTTLKTRQTTLFSASIPAAAEAAAREFLNEPLVLRLDARTPIPAGIAHWWFGVEGREKADFLRKVVHSLDPARTLVFLNKPDHIETLAAKLRHHGIRAESLHGTLFKADRQRALVSFTQGAVKLLVASDLAARGLHIDGVTHIVHFDIPDEPLDYQHRCGRTGRAGSAGVSIALADEVEQGRLTSFEKAFGITIQAKGLRQGTLYDLRK